MCIKDEGMSEQKKKKKKDEEWEDTMFGLKFLVYKLNETGCSNVLIVT